ncbi:MAG: penicillin-binding protein activator [Pseudomonadota bacterium]
MRQFFLPRIGLPHALRWPLLAATLVSCAEAPREPQTSLPTDPTEQVQSASKNPLTLPPSDFAEIFQTVEHDLAGFDWMQADVDLDSLPDETLNPDERIYRDYLQARIDYLRGDEKRAMGTLDGLLLSTTDPALRYRLLSFRQHALALRGDFVRSAQDTAQLMEMAPENTRAAWKRRTWLNLQKADQAALETAMPGASDLIWQGWLELALLSRSFQPGDSSLAQWRRVHPGHPAAKPLPGGLEYLQVTPPPTRAALLLPLSERLAPAGKAVLDGYLAAYYQARSQGSPTSDLLVLDSDQYGNINDAYNSAIAAGAQMVIGPLSKQAVADLGMRPTRPIPVLALNRVDETLPAEGSAMVQLSLTLEDEAGTLAETAFGDGARRALLIRPAGEWGDAFTLALQQRWETLGGTMTAEVRYTDSETYSDELKVALDLTASESRARAVRDMLATNLEFTARRRQDVDAVFLITRSGREARSIKPLLAFHYAGKLPVYSASTSYNGVPDPRNRDLDGVKILEMPWLLGSDPELRVAIGAGGTSAPNYTRLNALGADAFLLQRRFPALQAGPDVLIRGNTGLLTLDPQLHLRRDLSLATFDAGEIEPAALH